MCGTVKTSWCIQTRHVLNCRKTDHKIKNIAFYARVNDYAPVLILNEYTLYSGSAVLLKRKGGDYMLIHVASTCRSREEHRCAKKDERLTYVRKKKRKKDKLRTNERKQNTICEKGTKRRQRRDVRSRKSEMAVPSIVDIGNHIMNLIGRTISSLALLDKRKGSCSLRMEEENRRESSSEHDVETPLLTISSGDIR